MEPGALNSQTHAILTFLYPRLRHGLSADEHHNRKLSGSFNRLHELQLRPDEAEVGQVDVLARRRVRARGPEQRLIQRPRPDHDDCDVGRLRGGDGSGDVGHVVGPERAALRVVDLPGGVGEELGEARERRYTIGGRVEEDVVAELRDVNRPQ